ncbi:hypothetical protein [Microbacterium sp. NPDC089695]|uniref:hypothetical protein n=1 Tax=Microbacterium sp. NPDC089695 TaxID=3364198 RepID=UPI0037F41C15
MLVYVAAVAPIVASLYVCFSALTEYARQDHTARVYRRLEQWQHAETGKLYEGDLSNEEIAKQQNGLNERRAMLLEQSGIDPDLGTWNMFDRSFDPEPVRRVDVRRQWVLLWGSVIGVLALALDALGAW